MIYSGQAINVEKLTGDIAKLTIDVPNEPVNTFGKQVLSELDAASAALEQCHDCKGLLITSNKEAFVVGADITEFVSVFKQSEEDIIAMNDKVNGIFRRIENLPMPTVTLINGLALGGGFELALATDFRVMAKTAQVGLPEVKLGIFPGWGGTVRLPRLIGNDYAIEWICTGSQNRSDSALKVGAVDAVVEKDFLESAGLKIIEQCLAGDFDYRTIRAAKFDKVQLNTMEAMMVFETAKAFIKSKAGPHYPAPIEALKAMQKHASLPIDKALAVEAKHFAKVATSPVASSLVGLFLNDQLLKRQAKVLQKQAQDIQQMAVLGAGIMGGGIAYQAAYKGVPVVMKDIAESGLDLGLSEAKQLLMKRVERGRMQPEKMADTLNLIRPTLSYGDVAQVDLIVEAVVENVEVKKKVLAETEQHIKPTAILATNTSTISVSLLAQSLQRPENFCGMHFFNPVHKMPLVEVIRGEKTSDAAVATTVALAKAMGKNPIVVNDCPGFLVNRVLFPYFGGFALLLADGIEFQRIDRLMERFGWPMGPAYLLDVIGIDTAVHAGDVMAQGFPDRMAFSHDTAMQVLHREGRLGQKNKQGFYAYETDKKGKLKKVNDTDIAKLLAPIVQKSEECSDESIIERMMLPLCIETVRCLDEGIVATAAEADMGLVYGIGFPPFLGGALRYMDSVGIDKVCEQAKKYQHLGKLYHITDSMQDMASNGKTFFN